VYASMVELSKHATMSYYLHVLAMPSLLHTLDFLFIPGPNQNNSL
jgi:hypothetical protein